MITFLIVLVSIAAYIAAGSFVCQYMIARWEILNEHDDDYQVFKFFVSLGLPITIFVLIAYLIGDYATSVSESQSNFNRERNAIASQKNKNELAKLRIAEKELLAAEQELDNELQKRKA